MKSLTIACMAQENAYELVVSFCILKQSWISHDGPHTAMEEKYITIGDAK